MTVESVLEETLEKARMLSPGDSVELFSALLIFAMAFLLDNVGDEQLDSLIAGAKADAITAKFKEREAH